MKKTVTSKTKALNGFVLGVEFIDSKAETESPAALAYFKASDDFEVAEPKPAGKPSNGNGAS